MGLRRSEIMEVGSSYLVCRTKVEVGEKVIPILLCKIIPPYVLFALFPYHNFKKLQWFSDTSYNIG
jgi:hypothetical protein